MLCNHNDLLQFRFGSGSSFGKVFIPFSAPAAVPVPVQTIFSNFRKTNKLHKIFSMSEAAYFLESWPFILDFLTFLLYFMLDPHPNPEPKP